MTAARRSLVRKGLFGLVLFFLLFVICNDFLLPWYTEHGSTIEVPDAVGLTVEDAMRLLDSAGLEGREGDVRPDREHPAGIVVVQNPVAGHAVKKGRRIYLTVSGGEESVDVPGMRGRTLRDATFLLERNGLRMGDVRQEPSAEYPANTIIEQSVAPGAKVRKNSSIDVTVSLGPVSLSVTVPDLIGKTLSEAKRILESSGIVLGNVTQVPSADLLPNTVIEQFPQAGDVVDSKQAVDLVVVQGAARERQPTEY